MLESYDWGVLHTGNETNDLRTPLTLSDRIKDLITGKVFCDLGCGEGDFALCCKRYAKQVIGVEFDPDRAQIARMKGLDVIEGDLLSIPLPDADIYYLWVGRKGLMVLDRIPKGKTVIWVPQVDQQGIVDGVMKSIKLKHNTEKFTMDYIRSGIPMTWVYYVMRGTNDHLR
jgi:SAM-dependent methyltransferase